MQINDILREYAEPHSINNLGRPIAHSVDGIARFWRWFGASKAVDKLGRPMVLYHGTKVSFRYFDPEKSNSNTKTGVPISAFVFTTMPDVALSYAGQQTKDWGFTDPDLERQYKEMIANDDMTRAIAFSKQHMVQNVKSWADGGNVMPVYLRILRPLKISAKGDSWNDIYWKNDTWTTNELMQLAMEKKYDGLIVRNVHDRQEGSGKNGDTYAVFTQNQIKSAIANSGQFGDVRNIDEDELTINI